MKKAEYEDLISGNRSVWKEYYDNDEDFKLMSKKFSAAFYEMYNKGFYEYEQGSWESARTYLEIAEV